MTAADPTLDSVTEPTLELTIVRVVESTTAEPAADAPSGVASTAGPPLAGEVGSTATAVAVAECLLSVLRHEVSLDEALTRPLAQIGVESWAFTAFLVRIEKEFGIVWDFDVPAETFDSVGSIARYLDGQARA